MKKLLLTAAVILGMGTMMTTDVVAQGRGNGHGNKMEKRYEKSYEKEYKKSHKKYQKAYSKRHKGKYYNHNLDHRHGPPAWAPAHGYRMKNHLYFPDYHTFYDPRRNGYVYWGGNAWSFSPTLPAFLINVDLGRARISTMTDIPLNEMPEQYYDRYYRSNPPSGNININIPIPMRR